MCGIVGFTHRDWQPDPDRIRRATATLVHRGPDQQGVLRSGVCALGATRLKIIDLEGGDQPMLSDGGDVAVVFNGEIYNHQELRRELGARGHRFRSQSDTESILHAFLEWDLDAFARLRGMFAVALWTESARRLVLARDRLGIKPLYVARHGGDLLFGSELKALLVHPELDRHLSLPGLDCYLSLNYVPCPWTLVDGIEKLEPGHWLEWHDGDWASGAYWQLPPAEPVPRTLAVAKEELDALVRQSVREHLLSDVPLGVWLSGGIDSSTILHYAATVSSARLKTFSISFHGRTFDESAYIKRVVNQYGTEHTELDLNPREDLLGAIEEFAYYSDEPTADAGALPVWFLSKLTKASATVALSGEGADELFGGYLTYPADRLAAWARRLPPRVVASVLDGVHRWPVSDEKISFEYKVKRFLEGCHLSPERAHVHWNGTFSDAEKRTLLDRNTWDQAPAPGTDGLDRVLAELRDGLAAGDGLAPYLWFDQRYYLPDDILVKVDRMSMAHAVEVRPPFLDHRIVEFAATLPAALKVRGSRQKRLLKSMMAGRLPRAISRRKKIGFDIPAHQWLRGPLRSMLNDTVRDGLTGYPGLFRRQAVEGYLTRHLARQTNVGYHLWGLMILFLWLKQWRIQAPSKPTLPVAERVGLCT